MASNLPTNNPILPVSDTLRDEEKERLLPGEEKLFRGSAMTKRGGYAAISYMSCAGTYTRGNFLLFEFTQLVPKFCCLEEAYCFRFRGIGIVHSCIHSMHCVEFWIVSSVR